MPPAAVFVTIFLSLFALTTASPSVKASDDDDRLFVAKNLLDPTTNAVLAFTFRVLSSTGKLQYCPVNLSQPSIQQCKWTDLGSPAGTGLFSNPVGIHTSKKQIQIFSQGADGQVYSIQQLPREKIGFSSWTKLPLLEHQTNVTLNSKDSLTAGTFGNQTVVFARSVAKASSLYWCLSNDDGKFSAWARIGGSSVHLLSDATVILNTFTGYYEAFAVMTDGYVHRTWQRDGQRWADWRRMGIFQPKVATASRPVAIAMSYAFGNGALQVFFAGADGTVRNIFQTTCDGVDNPWGYCTWGVWHTASGGVPKSKGTNVLTVGQNIHLGGVLFVVDTTGWLWYSWQLERGSPWSTWQRVESFGQPEQAMIQGKPFVSRDDRSWWRVFATDGAGDVTVIEQQRSLEVEPPTVKSGSNLTVSWKVPVDEATGMDWIGLYPARASNEEYVDFRYVQGGQNPTSKPLPEGAITMVSYLPDGEYDVRYMVNRHFVSVIDKGVNYTDGSVEEPWVQVYTGIFLGLGAKGSHFKECVEDGNKTVATFRQSFDAFRNRQVRLGLHMLGLGLEDVLKTLMTCQETDIAKAMEKFVRDLVSCVEGDCLNFVIDDLDILLILYENVYEIFGDIRAASNSFNLIQAYEQGGLCIGRVVEACISLPFRPTPADKPMH